MKNIIILILISPIFSSAQSFENIKLSTKIGSIYSEKVNFFDNYINYGDYIFSFEILKNDINIKKFRKKDLKLVSTNIIEDIADELWIEHVGIYNDKFLAFYSLWNKKSEYEQLIVRELNTNTLDFIDDGKVLIKVKGKVTGKIGTVGFYKFQKFDKFNFKLSSDKQSLLIHYQKHPRKKDDDLNHNIIGFYAFDLSMNELWSQEKTLPYFESKMDTLGYFMTERNSAYMFIAVYTKKSNHIKIYKENKTCKFQLLKIEKDKPNIEIIDIPFIEEPEILTYVDIKLTKQNEFVIGGYYSKNYNYSSDGLYSFKFKPSGEIVYQMHYEFPLSFLNKYAKKSEKKKNKRKGENEAELSFLNLCNIYVDKNGALRIIGEQIYSDYRFRSDGKEDIRYFYKNIFISKINLEGEVVWNTQLPKYQLQKYFFDDMSFKYFDGNGLEYFFFPDATANKKVPIDDLPKMYLSGSPGTFAVFVVNSETGEFKRKYIFDTRNAKGKHIYYFQTSKIFQISDNEFGTEMYIKKKKEYAPLKITIN
jgi:hypothetical protein